MNNNKVTKIINSYKIKLKSWRHIWCLNIFNHFFFMNLMDNIYLCYLSEFVILLKANILNSLWEMINQFYTYNLNLKYYGCYFSQVLKLISFDVNCLNSKLIYCKQVRILQVKIFFLLGNNSACRHVRDVK